MPYVFDEATKRYDDKFLANNGILPWYIHDVMMKLTKAFRDKRKTEILFLAADLGHYIGDANMPLHTSVNHNGQLTNQIGIHGLFESGIPEMFGDNYNYHTNKPQYIANIDAAIWAMIQDSHSLVKPLLLADSELRKNMQLIKCMQWIKTAIAEKTSLMILFSPRNILRICIKI